VKNLRPALRSVGAVLIGFLVIALGTILTLEVWLGGISYAESSNSTLAFATVGACLSGLAGGMVAAFLASRRPLAHAFGLILPIGIDTSVFLASGERTDPLWFDLAGSATLMLSAIAGGVLLARLRCKTSRLRSPA